MALANLLPAVQAHPALAVLVVGFSIALAWALHSRQRASRELNLPFLRFEDGDDSRQRYVTDSGTLFKIGYDRYLKHGQAFKMRNYIEELPPQVYLPLKYLDEVKGAPQGKLSFPSFSRLLFLQDETGMAKQTDEAAHVIRTDLIRNQREDTYALVAALLCFKLNAVGLTRSCSASVSRAGGGERCSYR